MVSYQDTQEIKVGRYFITRIIQSSSQRTLTMYVGVVAPPYQHTANGEPQLPYKHSWSPLTSLLWNFRHLVITKSVTELKLSLHSGDNSFLLEYY